MPDFVDGNAFSIPGKILVADHAMLKNSRIEHVVLSDTPCDCTKLGYEFNVAVNL